MWAQVVVLVAVCLVELGLVVVVGYQFEVLRRGLLLLRLMAAHQKADLVAGLALLVGLLTLLAQ